MKLLLKSFAVLVLFVIGFNLVKSFKDKYWDEMYSKDGKYDVVDSMIGVTAVDKYLEIKEKQDSFNLPALKTSMMMFFTQNGRFPHDLEELEKSGEANSDLTHDRYGNRYDIKLVQRTVFLSSPGKDRIKGTTDDVEYKIQM